MLSGIISPTTQNSTSFISNICLDPAAPTQTQRPGIKPRSTHNQHLQHNSALVLQLSLRPPSLHPLLEALVNRPDLLTAGRDARWLTAVQTGTLEGFGFQSLAEIVAQRH